MSEAPPFWWEPRDWRALALFPASKIYGKVAARRLLRQGVETVGAPVLCIGNFTVGGTGKTPVAMVLADAARAAGLTPGILSRGHGGRATTAHLVDVENDTASTVGDEPLLLARHAAVAVTPKRADGARLLIHHGCNFLIMDDGFQSARVHFDYALLIVDARHGVGNGEVIPAGPLRAPLVDQLRRADAILRMGDGDAADRVVRMGARAAKPIFVASQTPVDAEWIAGRRFLAFAGIGHPDRFFNMVEEAGGEVVEARAFPDHHVFSRDELTELGTAAEKDELDIITTEKDAARLSASIVPSGFGERVYILKVQPRFENPLIPDRIIADTVAAYKRRGTL